MGGIAAHGVIVIYVNRSTELAKGGEVDKSR